MTKKQKDSPFIPLQLNGSKKDLIERSIAQVNVSTGVDEDWKVFLKENKEKDIEEIIKEENLREEETRRFIENAFRDGIIKTTVADIDRIIPPASRFASNFMYKLHIYKVVFFVLKKPI